METKIFKINSLAEDEEIISYCADVLRSEGLVVFPTETVYGLGADACSSLAAKKIYTAKGRPSDNPLIIHISTPSEAEGYAYTSSLYYKLAKRFMPGPLTVIMKSKDTVPLATRGGLDTVAVRCPENEVARALIKAFGKPVAAPSANLSGSPSPTSAKHVIDDLMGRVDVIIDGGECDFGLESTIVRIEEDGSLTLLRPGKITPDDLMCVTEKINISSAVKRELKADEVAQSPGMKYRHYAPKAPLVLLDGDFDAVINYLSIQADTSFALIYYSDYEEKLTKLFPNSKIYFFGKEKDELSQAKLLFSILRKADKQGYDIIYAPVPNENGIGLALYNRMIRAASHTIKKL